ncbi:MAG: prepilin-type N-terminal cleavage/methylation domain-containing protein [Microbacteriaceae bacterium]|jgi:prepilin-type N-terminal cleavage/methylation domain-containing protein|nr:prepilin-type N-terminal cleavage/methylation domain-containing protein [Microbacteriaceae bacterium]HOB56845.1 prepilin-type N-terminal cleavage/methylation domain-containing protein [Rhodoglobus sp.]HOT33842.1 prepilin-type N-terminal cleavage/methylation domain-containing protein [Rhodoglobus sp.]HQA22530.1 prepilin-type N-terminal cleavage/methylation domain-containing protein [Rhodoglobus sp.]HQE45751.1 prepilin-type N-terminal cleavage/methylation domain-containing protein [Rhodoglobus
MFTPQAKSASANDEGFTLVEVVVSIIVLALIALALLPLLIQGIKQSAQAAAIASAVQLANSQVDLARTQATTCTAVTATPTVAVSSSATYRGVPLVVTKTVGACPTPTPSATAPGTIPFTATVTRSDTGETLATVSTKILVTGG